VHGGGVVAAVGVVLLLAGLTGCGEDGPARVQAAPADTSSPSAPATSADAPAPSAPATPSDAASSSASPTAVPDELGVRCTDGGTVLAGPAVAMSVDGIHLRVTNETTAAGTGDTSVTYLVDGRLIGGNLITGRAAELGFAPAPGPVQVACWHARSDTPDAPVTIEVVDPAGNWRTPTTIADLGCQSMGEGYPTIHDGATADAAVQAAIDWEADGHTYRVRRTSGGYWRLPGYGFVLDRDSHPWAAGGVHREGDHWQASLSTICTPPAGDGAEPAQLAQRGRP
jgi:predicted small lipoprotein YifL